MRPKPRTPAGTIGPPGFQEGSGDAGTVRREDGGDGSQRPNKRFLEGLEGDGGARRDGQAAPGDAKQGAAAPPGSRSRSGRGGGRSRCRAPPGRPPRTRQPFRSRLPRDTRSPVPSHNAGAGQGRPGAARGAPPRPARASPPLPR